jgi:hypothetical protein
MVEEQKGAIGVFPVGAEGSLQAHTRAFDNHLRFDNLFY